MTTFRFLVILALIGGCQVLGDLVEFPENEAVYGDEGTTVILRCAARNSVPTARIMWTEFATSVLGAIISDNRGVAGSHPHSSRYAIIGSDLNNEFHLQITNVTRADGGAYLCQDINSGAPAVFRRYAELVVFDGEPTCRSYSASGNVIEHVEYTAECSVSYTGNLVPTMIWEGPPDTFYTNGTSPPNYVWSYLSFTARRTHEGQFFYSITNFTTVPIRPSYAENIPTLRHFHEGAALIVNWGPSEIQVNGQKTYYEVGDVLECQADSKPVSTYQWTNQRTLIPLPPGPTFTVTPDLHATNQSMRCQASVIIEGSLFTNDIFVPLHVPEVTTTSTTTPYVPTTPPAVSDCNNLNGRWQATNPTAMVCIDTDAKGNLFVLIRNSTDLFLGTGRGKTVMDDNSHVGFTTLWPLGGTAGFTGECHRCMGNEVLLMTGLSRNKDHSDQCGTSAGTQLTNLYVFYRVEGACLGMTVDEVHTNQPWILDKMGIKAKKIVPISKSSKKY